MGAEVVEWAGEGYVEMNGSSFDGVDVVDTLCRSFPGGCNCNRVLGKRY
jgi:hypothetical protein